MSLGGNWCALSALRMEGVMAERACRWSPGVQIRLWLAASKNTGPQSYSHKELVSANNLNDLEVGASQEPSDKSPASLHLDLGPGRDTLI